MHAWCERGIHISDKARRFVADLDKHKVARILVIRHAALGDMIITRPFLVEIKKLFPNAKITLDLVSQYKLAAPLDLVDDSHITFGQDMRGKGVFDKFKNMNELGEYDLVFDLANTSRSQWITRLTKASLKLGFPHRKMNWLYDVSILRSDFKFEAETLLDFLSLFGHKSEYPLNFALAKNKQQAAAKKIAYFMGASIKEKCYPLDRFENIIDQMASLYSNHQHCILQGAKPDEKFEDVFGRLSAKHSNIELIKLMPVDDLVEWSCDISLLISNDTGVRNLAIATHTPTLGLFFEAIPFRYIPRYEHIHEALLNTRSHIVEESKVVETAKSLLS